MSEPIAADCRPQPGGEPSWAAYRTLARTCPKTLKTGLNLAFYRCFAIPGIARTLVDSGGITRRPTARAKATGAHLFRLLEEGFDTAAARETVRHLRAVHRGLPADDGAFAYVLGLFCVHPLRFAARYGPRPATAAERDAAYAFYAELGRRMELTGPPPDFEALAAFTDAYEARHARPTPEAQALWRAARQVFAERLPAPVAPLGPVLAECLLDEAVRTALGVGRRPRPLRAAAAAALRRYLARAERP
ncbi:oxygenase MpaB family protein [Streptomyces carminius]|uniref:oxygenase MpaB family protein n=1 Tax=Streptomyces carminius TaxID=2665496 RepID=UPI0018EC678C|nr:oxygenase MpaB family protein [Streptomyces carminius]